MTKRKRNHKLRNRLRAAGGLQLKFASSDVEILAAKDGEEDKRPRFQMIAYTGGADAADGFHRFSDCGCGGN